MTKDYLTPNIVGSTLSALYTETVPRLLIILGLGIALVGTLWLAFPRAITWFGQLPGDINIRREHTRVFIPITSTLVLSLVLSLVLRVLVNAAAWLSKLSR